MVHLARDLRGLTQAELATAAGVTQGLISQIEHGRRDVPSEKMTRLAHALGFPLPFFEQQADYSGFGLSFVFYRRRASARVGLLRRLQAEVNLRRLHVASLLSGIELETANQFPAMEIDEHDGRVEQIANLVRAAWCLPLGPVKNLIATVESAGGIVIRFSFGTKTVDAISQWPVGLPPLFFINADTPTDRMRWSLAHELGHMVMHQHPSDEIEVEANRFASEFLMPTSEIRSQLHDISIQRAASLKPHWRVSMAALIKRARDVEVIDNQRYESLFRRMGYLKYRKHEPVDIAPEAPSMIGRFVDLYATDYGYSDVDLAHLLHLNDDEFRSRYGAGDGLQLAH